MQIDWESLLAIDSMWLTTHLCTYAPLSSHKLKVRAYSLKFSGTQQRIESFIDFTSNYIDKFCFSSDQIKQLHTEGKQPWKEARNHFGVIDPESDGKLGELLLFLFVEGVLRTPLMAHKISFLTNPNDQVKGGDGVFLGNYQGNPAILIGEAKIKTDVSKAISEAFESLNRFHDHSATLNYEISIAPRMIRTDLGQEQLDHICMRLLKPSSQEYHACIKVHPVLIVYNDGDINSISRKAATPAEAESIMSSLCCTHLSEHQKTLITKLAEYPHIAEVYLDFFFLPVADVTRMRACFYEQMHGIPPFRRIKQRKRQAK